MKIKNVSFTLGKKMNGLFGQSNIKRWERKTSVERESERAPKMK